MSPRNLLFIVFVLLLVTYSLVRAHDDHEHHHDHHDDIEPPSPDPGLINPHSSSPYAVPHHCIHDTHIVPQMLKEDAEFAAQGRTRPEARFAHPDGREAQVLAVGNMRWIIRTTDLYDTTKYCTAASGSVKNMK